MKTIFIDMDDCICDFQSHKVFDNQDTVTDVSHMHDFGFFLSLKPMPGALVAIRALINLGFNVQILSQPVAESAHSYSEKIQWLGMWVPDLIKKVNLVQDKSLLSAPGRYLVDDNSNKWKDRFEANGGKFVHFQYARNDDKSNRDEWARIVTYFKIQKELK